MAADSPPAIDLEQVRKLVQTLERDLERVEQGGGDLAALRAEVEALRAALHSHDSDPTGVHEGLRSMRQAVEETEAPLLRGAQYVAEIGRILGM